MDKSNTLIAHTTINIQGTLMDLSTPKVMGIINVTPDSFFSGSRKESEADVLRQAEKMISEGAEILDIGGYSTRPGAAEVTNEEEINRVCGPIEAISKQFPDIQISIDTFRADVATAAVGSGASIVNDISAGLLDAQMLETVGKLKVPYIAMHMRGTPQTMKELTSYDDLLKEVMQYFSERIAKCKEAGIKDIIVDPGFGFAKTIEQNYYLLNSVDYLKQLGLPLLIGVSRKSMIYKVLNIEPEAALNGTTVLNTLALLKGASILRVHDVKEAVEAVKLINQITA
ncbi:dihydropteroate synthase [Marinoscillum pacificum]|uniref:dihydropteroate synthase n=1 Tax=Marinoscillum pacificum TaxID=392723 RepID=UPI0021576389|nr:dihydropteroate synthase [Marinoscillum pacificum]